MPERIEIEGLKAAQKKLKQLGDIERTRQYKVANAKIAEDVVIPAAKAKASTRMEQRAADTLVPVKSVSGGAVRLGRGFAGALGAEFGAGRNQRRRGRPRGTVATVSGWNQFKPWRGSGREAGYFLWPAIRDREAEIIDRYAKLFEEMFDQDGV
jgi:hypothetical protein